ncbi:unnamed protein product, partial [Mesorhabditis spiculigera]
MVLLPPKKRHTKKGSESSSHDSGQDSPSNHKIRAHRRGSVEVDEPENYDRDALVFYVNGRRVVDGEVDPRTTLVTYLRDHLRLTGTKIGCNEGGCGACTVMISEVDPISGEIRHFSANSCLMPVCGVFGKAVTTCEGIQGAEGRLHPVQERLSKCHGSQCGYCTPGFIMAMYSLLRNNPKPSREDVDLAIQGNLCRCTGYRPILEAFYSFADENGDVKITESGCAMGDKCCKKGGDGCGGDRKTFIKLSDLSSCAKFDPSQELIFPPELKLKNFHQQSLLLDHNGHRWFQPTAYDMLLALKRKHPHARVISGNSELAVELKFRFIPLDIVINPRQVPELHEHRLTEFGAYLGTGLSLTQMEDALRAYSKELPESKCRVFKAVNDMLHWFAGRHVRNVASVAGNIATASPISDLNPIWMASRSQVVLESEERGIRTLPIDEKFFIGYRKTVIQGDEVVKAVIVPFSDENEHFYAYKLAQRREDDIAIVTGAFRAKVNPATHVVEDIGISYGGMDIFTKLALKTMAHLKGKKWNKALLDEGIDSISKEFALKPDVPGGMPRFRQALTLSFFLKFFLQVAKNLEIDVEHADQKTLIGDTISQSLEATQLYQEVPDGQPVHDPVGRPIQHVSGEKHTTGEAMYTTDVNIAGLLHAALVLAPIAHGTIDSVDATKALEIDGVVAYFDHSDLPTDRLMGHHDDTLVFAKDEVTYHCQPIGIIVARDHETARRGANAVQVQCTAGKPIVTVEEAIEANSWTGQPFQVHSQLSEGKPEWKMNDWTQYKRIVEGTIKMGGQEHFYFETHNCIAIPNEDRGIDMIVSTQGVNDVQIEVSKILNIPRNRVNIRVKRVGGGFGGKESTNSLSAVPCALAALKLQAPVKLYLERFDDMAITGHRHPFNFNYKVALSEEGKLLDYEVTAFANGGHTLDLSAGVLTRAMVHIDNVYKFGNAHIYGRICRTNTASNTAFRGFGGPQGMFCTETLMKHIAETYDLDVDELREKNLYKEGEMTPFGMHLRKCNAKRTWDECREFSRYDERKRMVAEFNKQNRFRKRGIYVMPTKFGIGFGLKFMNQASALVLVYTDGSVLISHGGMEMGQGLHTKILQIAARCLDIPIDLIHIEETATDKVPNASPTAASVGSDLCGVAVQNACDQLTERLKPYKEKLSDKTWKEWVAAAYMDRVSLSASGFGIIHNEPVDFFNGKGAELFGYCVYGTACCEVEVDCLTGDHRLLSTHIVMDIGDSLNPAIDIGQIEGAFIQGYGLFTMEEIRVRPNGMRLTRGPGNYKIPSADDVPRDFHVALLKGSSNPSAIFASKAVGEPPLFLGATVFFAVREAIRAYRIQNGKQGYFRFDSPATPEAIRMACEDEYLEKIPSLPEAGTFTPWTVPL